LTAPTIQIDLIHQHGRPAWKVRMGRRAVVFHEELAARTFAAQLHMRLNGLEQREPSDEQQPR